MQSQITITEHIRLLEEEEEDKRQRRIWVKRTGPALPYDARYEEMKAKWISSGTTAADMVQNPNI